MRTQIYWSHMASDVHKIVKDYKLCAGNMANYEAAMKMTDVFCKEAAPARSHW